MTLLVEKLETLDKNNVLKIRREIVALKNKLKECEASKDEPIPVSAPGPPPSPGECPAPRLPLNLAWRGQRGVGEGFGSAAPRAGFLQFRVALPCVGTSSPSRSTYCHILGLTEE